MPESLKVKFYIVHYTKLTDRKAFILDRCKKAGIRDFTMIESCNPEDISEETYAKFTRTTRSQISLFLKHIEFLKIVANGEDDYLYIVSEDDSMFEEDFMDKLKNLLTNHLPEKWDVLFLGDCCGLRAEGDKPFCEVQTSRGTGLYVVSKLSATKFLNIYNSEKLIGEPIDFWFNKIKNLELKYYWAEPALLTQGSQVLFGSTVSAYNS